MRCSGTSYPRLCDCCQKHGSRFKAIDLRWAVSKEAAAEHAHLVFSHGNHRISIAEFETIVVGQATDSLTSEGNPSLESE